MIIGMRGHDFGRMEPEALAAVIKDAGFACTQLAFTKAFPQPVDAYMTPEALHALRAHGISIPALGCYISASDKMAALHLKDGVYNAEGKWKNRPLGEGIMDWANLLPRMREVFDSLCVMREGVWPGLVKEECVLMHRWMEGAC